MRERTRLITLAVIAFVIAGFVSCNNDANDEKGVAMPIATPVSGAVASGETVTLKTATAGAEIWYTTDGSDPMEGIGTKYENPIVITAEVTIKAIAVKGGMSSGILTVEYSIAAPGTDDNIDITIARIAVEGATYKTIEELAGTAEAAKNLVEAIIGNLKLNGVSATVVGGSFTAAANEVDGSYTFTVNLNKGTGVQQTTGTLTLAIRVMPSPVVIFSLDKWFETPPEATEFASSAGDTFNHSPFRLHGTVPTSNSCLVLEDTLEFYVNASGQGLHIQLDSNGLDIDVTENLYNFRISGYVLKTSDAGNSPLLRVNAIFDNAQFALLNQTAIAQTVNHPFDISFDIHDKPTTSLRLTVSSNAARMTFIITDIQVTDKGPRQ